MSDFQYYTTAGTSAVFDAAVLREDKDTMCMDCREREHCKMGWLRRTSDNCALMQFITEAGITSRLLDRGTSIAREVLGEKERDEGYDLETLQALTKANALASCMLAEKEGV